MHVFNELRTTYFDHKHPRLHLKSFMDNLEVHGGDASEALEGLDALRGFSALLDVEIDEGKTYGWSTTTQGRNTLKEAQVP